MQYFFIKFTERVSGQSEDKAELSNEGMTLS